jgi:hypothetical protein
MTRLALLICVALLVALPAATAGAATVKAPKGTYEGAAPTDALLQASKKAISIAAFSFRCSSTVYGRTSLNEIPVKKTDRGYRFSIVTKAIASYTDESNENVSIELSGRFATNAKTVSGRLRVKSKKCGDTGRVKWSAART